MLTRILRFRGGSRVTAAGAGAAAFTAMTLALLALTPARADAAAAGGRVVVAIDATKQGVLKGEEKSGKIAVTAVSLEARSPRDAATGQVSGKVQNLPVTITKVIDATSPQLFQALATNEIFKSVVIEFYGVSPDGGADLVTQTIRLTNAHVAGLRQYGGDAGGAAAAAPAADAQAREEVTLSYQTIEFVGAGGGLAQGRPDTAPPVVAPVPVPGTGLAPPRSSPTVTRTPRGVPIEPISPQPSPALTPAPGIARPAPTAITAAPAEAPAPTPAPTAAATTEPTDSPLSRAARARRRAAAAAATSAPTTAPAAKPDPATQPAAPQPVAPAPPRKKR